MRIAVVTVLFLFPVLALAQIALPAQDCPKPILSIRGPCPDPCPNCPPAPDCVCECPQPAPVAVPATHPVQVTVQPAPVVTVPAQAPPRALGGLVLPLTAAYLADDWAAGAGLGYQFSSGVMLLGQALYWNGTSGDGSSSSFVSSTSGGGSDDTHCGHGHFPPCDPGQTTRFSSSSSGEDGGEWGAALTLVIPLGR